MKTKPTFSLAQRIALLLLLLSTLNPQLSTVFAQGTAFTYQGRLNSGGSPANGFFDITFSVWNASGGPAQVGGTIASNAVPVSNGLFTVTLDFGTGVFSGADRWLEISVRTNGGGGFTALTPRQKLTATPYAIISGNLSGTLPATQLSGTVPEASLPANVARLNASQSFSANNVFLANVGIGSLVTSNRLEIADAQARARITSSGLNGSALEFANNNEDPSSLGSIDFTHVSSGLQGQIGYSWNGMDFLTANQPRVRIDSSGRVGIGTISPTWPLDVQANQAVGRFVSTAGAYGSVMELKNTSASPVLLGAINFNDAANTYPGQIAYSAGDALTFFAGHAERMRVSGSGNVGIGTSSPAEKLHVSGNVKASGRVMVEMNSSLSSPQLQLHETQDGNFARLEFQVASRPYWHIAVGGGAANQMNFYNSTNGDVMSLTQDGTLFVKVLTITGGADIAEPFRLSEAKLPEGSVVVIDEENPGHLKLSTRAYDTRVAGVISGAGGVQPGLSLRQQGVMEGNQPVALTGRVYVRADATRAAIKPGDLLTTSNTPGHAMKVTEHIRAQGAVLGKAMTPLREDTGLVLVLVTLQ